LHQGVFLSFHSSRFLPLEGNSTPLPSQITTVESPKYRRGKHRRAVSISYRIPAALWGLYSDYQRAPHRAATE